MVLSNAANNINTNLQLTKSIPVIIIHSIHYHMLLQILFLHVIFNSYPLGHLKSNSSFSKLLKVPTFHSSSWCIIRSSLNMTRPILIQTVFSHFARNICNAKTISYVFISNSILQGNVHSFFNIVSPLPPSFDPYSSVDLYHVC